MNKVILIGKIISELSERVMPNKAKCVEFRIATEDYFVDSNGQKGRDEDTHVIRAWGAKANVLWDFAEKGKKIAVEGKSKFEKWVDRQTGLERNRTVVVIESFEFVEKVERNADYDEREDEG